MPLINNQQSLQSRRCEVVKINPCKMILANWCRIKLSFLHPQCFFLSCCAQRPLQQVSLGTVDSQYSNNPSRWLRTSHMSLYPLSLASYPKHGSHFALSPLDSEQAAVVSSSSKCSHTCMMADIEEDRQHSPFHTKPPENTVDSLLSEW